MSPFDDPYDDDRDPLEMSDEDEDEDLHEFDPFDPDEEEWDGQDAA